MDRLNIPGSVIAGFVALTVCTGIVSADDMLTSKAVNPSEISAGGTATVTVSVESQKTTNDVFPLDVMIVIDTSETMGDPMDTEATMKLLGAVAFAAAFVDELGLQDQVGLVTFGGEAELERALSFDRQGTIADILALPDVPGNPGGTTPIADGIETAHQHLMSNGRAGAVPKIILLSDGIDTAGGTEAAALQARAEGTTIMTISYGPLDDQFPDPSLLQLAVPSRDPSGDPLHFHEPAVFEADDVFGVCFNHVANICAREINILEAVMLPLEVTQILSVEYIPGTIGFDQTNEAPVLAGNSVSMFVHQMHNDDLYRINFEVTAEDCGQYDVDDPSARVEWIGPDGQADQEPFPQRQLTVSGCCMAVCDEELLCETDGDFTYTFDIKNSSGVTAHWLLIPAVATVPNDNSVTLSPNVIPLNPPLPPDGVTTATIQLDISGADPGEEVCFRLILTDENVVECCSIETCVELPPCDCLQIRAESIDDPVCSPDGLTVDFDYSFTIENLFGQVLEHAFLLSLTPGVTFDPDYFDLPSVPPNGQVNLSTTVLGASPGQEVCFLVTVHNANLEECCSIQHCITAPDCPGTGACCYTFGGLQICNEVTEPECSQLGGTFLPDTPCDPDPCAPTGACCILDPGGFVFCIVVPESECSGFAFFPGADCDPEPCTVTGACCLPEGGCVETTNDQCAVLGGVFTIGPCDPTVCEPTGACCLVDPNGTVVCFEGPASQCGPDGQFFPDETCDPGPCFLPSTCPSDCNLDGVVDVLDLVSVVAAWGSDDASADINGNGVVEVGDLVRVIEAWGPCP